MQLPLRAEQLSKVPTRFCLLRARQRLVDHNQPIGNLPGTTETRSQLGKKQTQVVVNGRLRQSVEAGLEQLRARVILPSLDEHDPLEALCPDVPDLQSVPGRDVGRHADVVAGGREIADIQRDRTRRDEQRVQEREHVILWADIFDETLCEPACLIPKSLQPEDPRVIAIDQHSLVVLIDVRRPNRREARANQRLEVSSRARLVSQNVQRKPDESVADRHVGTIRGLGCHGAELLGETEGDSILACGEAMEVESVYRSQPVPGVVDDLGKLESLAERGAHVRGAAGASMHDGIAKREIKTHVTAWIGGHLTSEACNGLLDSSATLRQQRQVRPERYTCRGQRHANTDMAARRKGPVEGCAQVVDVQSVRSEPLDGGPGLQLGLGMLKEVSKVLGVASRDVVEFCAPDELLARVRARRLEQTILQARTADIRR